MSFFADSHEFTLHGYCAACAAHELTVARQAAPANSSTKVAKNPP